MLMMVRENWQNRSYLKNHERCTCNRHMQEISSLRIKYVLHSLFTQYMYVETYEGVGGALRVRKGGSTSLCKKKKRAP